MKHAIIAALATITLAGCKKDKPSEPETAARDAAAAAAPAAPVDPDPYYEPIPDKPVDAGPPPPAVAITGAGTPLFDAASGTSTPGGWTVDATELRFETVAIGITDEAADVQITMASGGRRARIATCRDLRRSGSGAVTAYKSGTDVVFISCFTSAGSGDKGRSWGVRVKWNKTTRIAEVVDRFETEGQPDFDEGE